MKTQRIGTQRGGLEVVSTGDTTHTTTEFTRNHVLQLLRGASVSRTCRNRAVSHLSIILIKLFR